MTNNIQNEQQNAKYIEGTTLLESLVVIQFIVLLHFIVILLKNIYIAPLKINNHITVFYEFTILIIPLALLVTCLSNFTYINYFILIVVIFFLVIFNMKNINSVGVLYSHKRIEDHKNPFITRFRSLVNIFSVLCILAVDFNIFPKRFAKTEVRGYGLMDVGTGLYVVSNGLVTRLHGNFDFNTLNTYSYDIIKKALPLLLMGIGRFILVKLIGYHQNVFEYGIHWNFFITLAVLKILNGLLLPILNKERAVISTLILVFVHQLALSYGVEDWICFNESRSTFVLANKEGIFSLIGYEILYLCGIIINVHLPKRGDYMSAYITIIKKSSILFVFFIVFTKVCETYIGISRRTANLGYISWLLAIIFMITLLGVISELFSCLLYDKMFNYNENTIPLILKAVNYNGILFFLLANIMTGIINISINTSLVSHSISLIIIIVYMCICCYTVCLLYFKQLHVL